MRLYYSIRVTIDTDEFRASVNDQTTGETRHPEGARDETDLLAKTSAILADMVRERIEDAQNKDND